MAGCGGAALVRGRMSPVEGYQVFQPRRFVFWNDGDPVRPSPHAGLAAPELACKFALAPAEHGKAEQQAMGGHDPDGSRGRERFILNTRPGFGDEVDRSCVFKMNTPANSRRFV